MLLPEDRDAATSMLLPEDRDAATCVLLPEEMGYIWFFNVKSSHFQIIDSVTAERVSGVLTQILAPPFSSLSHCNSR